MLLNKKIQMQRPNKLHNKTQQPVEEKIQLHKDPTHCIVRSNHISKFLPQRTRYTHQNRDGGLLETPTKDDTIKPKHTWIRAHREIHL